MGHRRLYETFKTFETVYCDSLPYFEDLHGRKVKMLQGHYGGEAFTHLLSIVTPIPYKIFTPPLHNKFTVCKHVTSISCIVRSCVIHFYIRRTHIIHLPDIFSNQTLTLMNNYYFILSCKISMSYGSNDSLLLHLNLCYIW